MFVELAAGIIAGYFAATPNRSRAENCGCGPCYPLDPGTVPRRAVTPLPPVELMTLEEQRRWIRENACALLDEGTARKFYKR